MKLNGRTISTSCPYSGECWADQFCLIGCPDTLLDVLKRSALLEHELEMLPHTDPDLIAVCEYIDCRHARLPKPPGGCGGGSR